MTIVIVKFIVKIMILSPLWKLWFQIHHCKHGPSYKIIIIIIMVAMIVCMYEGHQSERIFWFQQLNSRFVGQQ